MRVQRCLTTVLLAAGLVFGAKKVISPNTTGSNEQIDLDATLVMTEDEVTQQLGMDPGVGIVLLRVKVTPKTDTPVQVSPDDFILLAHDDGERARPFSPAQIAGQGALVENTKEGSVKKTSGMAGLGGMVGMGGGGGLSPGSSRPVAVNPTMNDKSNGNNKLLETLKAKQLPTTESAKPVEGFLYFPLDGKHKLKNLAVLYRGPAGKLDLEFVH
jgi:hypothetical protein